MSIGIVEIISLLMGISGFSVGTNPTAPTPQAALEYAMPDADIIAYADIGAIVPGNYKVLTGLANQPQVKASPELAKSIKELIKFVEDPRQLAKGMVGVDLVTDISDVTASLKIQPKADPDFVVAVHGKFSAATVEKVAKLAQKQTVKVGSATLFDTGEGQGIGVTKGGVLLAGSIALVKERMADTWKAPTGDNIKNATDVLGAKPVFAMIVGLSQTARTFVLSEIKGTNFVTDALKRHKLCAFSVHKDGIGWQWIDSTKSGLEGMAQISDGVVDVLRASQIAPRGFAKIILGALDSYKGTNKQVDEMIRRKADIMKIAEAYTGDGQFKAQIDKDPKTLKLSVRLTGKSLSEVMPIGGMMPVGALFFLTLRSGGKAEAMSAPAATSVPPKATLPPPPPPAKKQGSATKRP
jgi:hypothetical protein